MRSRGEIRQELEVCADAVSRMIGAEVARLGAEFALSEVNPRTGLPLLLPLYEVQARVLAGLALVVDEGPRSEPQPLAWPGRLI